MPTELRVFQGGGMNTDDSPNTIQQPDYITAFNFRVNGTAEGEANEGTNIEGSELLPRTLQDGLNKAIGAERFETIRKALSFIYNSQGFHQIVELDYDTQTQTVLFTNKTDSGGEDILSLNPQNYINDLKLIGDTFLVFTDNNMEPCYINLERLREGGYGTLTQEDFLLAKAQVLVPPTAVYNDDSDRSVNLMNGKLFQFRVQLVYLDNELSAWSTISKRPFPENEGNPDVGTDVTQNNNIIVGTKIGTDRVKRVIVSARIGDSDWFTIKDVNRADIIAITDTAIDVDNLIYEAYDPTSGLYSFTFYNDGLYNNIDVLETDLLADSVPNKVGTLEVLNGNVLALADCTEGYERPDVDVSVTVSAYQPELGSVAPDLATAMKITAIRSGVAVTRVIITGNPKTGDEFTITKRVGTSGSILEQITFPVQADEEDNRVELAKRIAQEFPNASYESDSTSATVKIGTFAVEYVTVSAIDYANAATGTNKSICVLKSNSSYQAALAHYDDKGRPFPISTDDRYIFKTQSYSQLQGLASMMNWQINSTPPEGAVSAQWLLSLNNTHQASLYVVGKVHDSTSQYLRLNINALEEFNEGNSASILNYDFARGDRVTLHYYDNSGTKVWFTSPSIDVEVISYEPVVDTTPDPDVTNYLLKVRLPSALVAPSDILVADITGKNIMMEIYTPKQRTVESSDGEVSLAPTLYYEVGEQIDIVDGAYSVTSGSIREGDAFFKTRQYENAVTTTLETYEVESFNFSDFYISNFTSYGRPRSYYDIDEYENKKASIRYSDVFRLGSEVNGITRFYPERIYGEGDGETASNYGAIEKIRQRDNTLIIIQSLKIAHSQIFGSIIEDQIGQQQIAISDRILGQARYIQSGKYGMGGAKESYAESRNGTIYFIDYNNSEPIRDGYNGVKSISGKMSKYFKRTLQEAKRAGKKVHGWWDEYNNEYVCAIEQDGDILQEFRFSVTNWRYEDTYTVDPATITLTTLPTKGTATLNPTTGAVTYRSNPGESGSDFYEFSFVVDGNTITKRKCFNISLGDTTVNEFSFGDLTNQQISTVVSSNSVLVDGINVPVTISITGGEYRITRNGVVGSWTSVSDYAELYDIVEVRQTTSADDLTATNTVLTIGSASDTFTATTGDTTPDAYSFTDVTDATTSTVYESNTITITGITLTVPVTITGGEYSKNGGAYTSVAGTAVATDTFKVRQTSSTSNSTATNTILTVGKTSDTYTVTTVVAPEQFIFVDQTGAQLNTVTESNAIIVTNFPPSSAISITTPGEYQINGGAWVTTAGTVSDGDSVKVRVTSSNTNNNNVSTTLTIGSLADTFTVTTGYAFNVESYGGENSVVQLLNSADSVVIDSETVVIDGSWTNVYDNSGDVKIKVINNRGIGISLEYSIKEGIDNTGTVLYSGIITNSGADGETFTTPALTVRNLYVRVFTT